MAKMILCDRPFLLLTVMVGSVFASVFDDIAISYTYPIVEDSGFRSTEITDVRSCIKLCHVYTSCKAVNFRRRGNVCRMVHNLDWDQNSNVLLEKTPGVITWVKVVPADDGTVCQPQDHRNYCKTYCGQNFELLHGDAFDGNIVEAGSKMSCKRCFSLSKPLARIKVTATCSEEGIWVFRDDRCENDGIECQLLLGDYGKYAMIFNRKLNYERATEACTSLDASLVQITTYTRLKFYMDVIKSLDVIVNGYWIDAHDVDGTWKTSDGQEISTDVINHYDDKEPCARIDTRVYRVHNLGCGVKFGFICEV